MANAIPVVLIKERANIVDYIMKYYTHIKLIRSGNVYQASCPFHDENSGSFTIFPNGTYKCFGCHVHGDIIQFVMEIEGLNFKEACKVIADNVDVQYEIEPPNPDHEAYKDNMDNHTRRYWKVLRNTPIVLNYLKVTRGLTDQIIQDFRIGLVPDDEYKYRNDLGNIAGRISFPILEHRDIKSAKCVGMGYRTLKDEKPKYLNDCNQDGRLATDKKPAQDPKLAGVFIKGQCLYGYPQAFQSIRKLNYAVVVEGYMDVISMHQSLITNTVACLGTALTEYQMDIIKKLTSNLIFFLDNDSAGMTNMFRVLPMLLEKGFNVMILSADGGKDAGDLCVKLKFDEGSIRTYVTQNCNPAMNVVIDKAVGIYEQIAVRERMKALNQIAPILDKIPKQMERDIFKNLLYKRLDIQ